MPFLPSGAVFKAENGSSDATRGELLDHVIVFSENHLKRLSKEYIQVCVPLLFGNN